MSAATFVMTPMQDAVVNIAHQPWCTEHWHGDGESICWADDIDLQIQPDAEPDGERGHITVMMTHDPKPRYNRTRNLAIFVDRYPDGEDSTNFDPDEAEIAAHALLAMVSLGRGETSAAEWHRTTAEEKAAALLARRTGGAK